MAARKKTKTTELTGSTDPTTPLDSAAFLKAAAPVLPKLKEDLHARSEASLSVRRALEARHEADRKAKRTGDSFAEWRAHFVDQVAAAWLLSCVFVRTLEDRGLLGHARLAGPGAQDSQTLFFELAPSLTERDYLLTVFRELSRFPATAALFDGKHNPVWMLAPSAEAAKELLQLFRAPRADAPAFRFGQASTRFLGDLYQDLDEGVRKRFALLQTPDFVEEYILDKTLEPAIQRFGLDEATLIDPTCGSGHFLLGAFARLYEQRRRAEPDASERDAVQKALSAVAGADINPYAVAIARLRLTLAALEKAGYAKLANAPALPIRLAVADSLLYNPQLPQQELGMQEGVDEGFLTYALEDAEAAREVLHRQYAAVVGNPPYIACKDPALREKYRKGYPSAFRAYSLGVPFTERFFQLGGPGASIGLITANSFMKREFGKKLVEEILPTVNLTRVENTSGAYIPGHGTPTVLLFGTAERPQDTSIRAILANRGEPSTPEDPSQGLVWRSFVSHGDEIGFENDFITVAEVSRDSLSKHPWSLGGGGATELKELLEDRAQGRLGDVITAIGRSTHTGEDGVFFMPAAAASRLGFKEKSFVPLVKGEQVRDWVISEDEVSLFPYDRDGRPNPPQDGEARYYWQYQSVLRDRQDFGQKIEARGLQWFEHSMFFPERYRVPLSIAFAFVATHNHFVLDRGGKVFKQTAPIIKLPEGATEEDHLALLAYLNSSTACFWMKQVFFDKGNRGEGGGFTAEAWEKFYEFDGTKLRELPLPKLAEAEKMEAAAFARAMSTAAAECEVLRSSASDVFSGAVNGTHIKRALEERNGAIREAEDRLRACQERLDWWFYERFQLTAASPAPMRDRLPPGARASDVVFATAVNGGAPGQRYFELCRLPAPPGLLDAGWSQQHDLRRSLDEIEANSVVRLIEQPIYKRTFREGFRPADWKRLALNWLMIGLETGLIGSSAPTTFNRLWTELAKRVSGVASVDEVVFEGGARAAILDAIHNEAAAFLAAHRFTESGLEKHAEWQKTWDLQRREDAGENVGEIPVPPKYDQKDYRDPAYWRLRGKLDVPKERLISYPGCESDEDGEPVYGWAGWNHLQRAQALAALYNDRKDREGWAKERLLPMLAGILELLPWIKQWHNEPDAEYEGLRLGDYFEGFLEAQLREHGATMKDLASIRPQAAKKKSATRKKAEA